jgi:hypothetical protein
VTPIRSTRWRRECQESTATSNANTDLAEAFLARGILASLTYVATDIIACLLYPGYNFIDQTVARTS